MGHVGIGMRDKDSWMKDDIDLSENVHLCATSAQILIETLKSPRTYKQFYLTREYNFNPVLYSYLTQYTYKVECV